MGQQALPTVKTSRTLTTSTEIMTTTRYDTKSKVCTTIVITQNIILHLLLGFCYNLCKWTCIVNVDTVLFVVQSLHCPSGNFIRIFAVPFAMGFSLTQPPLQSVFIPVSLD